MTDTNLTMIELLTRHKNAVDAITAFSCMHPSCDDLHPLIALLSENLEVTFAHLYLATSVSDSSTGKSGDSL